MGNKPGDQDRKACPARRICRQPS